MKKMLETALLVLVLGPLSSNAQIQWFVSLDEYGNGTANNGTATLPVPYQVMPDPSGGLAGVNVLVYNLPFQFPAASVGDYLMLEPPYTGAISDIVRFWAPAGAAGNTVIFYSDLPDANEQPPFPLADTGLPASLLPLNSTLLEGGVEGGYQVARVSPISGQPGYIGAGLATYTFISDVPEPCVLTIAGLGFAGLALMACRRRST